MIGQISGARRRCERTLPRRPGKPPRRCPSAPGAPDCGLPPAGPLPAARPGASPPSWAAGGSAAGGGLPSGEAGAGRPVQMTARPSPWASAVCRAAHPTPSPPLCRIGCEGPWVAIWGQWALLSERLERDRRPRELGQGAVPDLQGSWGHC